LLTIACSHKEKKNSNNLLKKVKLSGTTSMFIGCVKKRHEGFVLENINELLLTH
jgi:hypothetical protein